MENRKRPLAFAKTSLHSARMGVSETESPEDVAARQRLKKISLSRLSDSYIAALEIADVYSLLTKHSQGEWPPARPELKL